MKSGRRALGVAESYRGAAGEATSSLAGVVVRANGTVDDFAFGRCTVGGRDATDAICDLWGRLDRPDVRYLFVAGVALAWYNILDLEALSRRVDRPVLAITFEESRGLEAAIDEAFDGEKRAKRLDAYEALPDRFRMGVGETTVFVRAVGLRRETAVEVVRAYTEAEASRRRPEPLRIAKRLARRVDAAGRDGTIAQK